MSTPMIDYSGSPAEYELALIQANVDPARARVLRRELEQQRANYVRRGDATPEPPATLTTYPPQQAKPRVWEPEKRTEKAAARKEHDIQVALFRLIDDPKNQRQWPELALCFAVPNGGARTPRTAGMLKAEGVRPGVPDVWLPVARGEYKGLVIEMKRPAGTTTPEQAHWMSALNRQGWLVCLFTDEDAAFAEITAYLSAPQ